MAVPTQYYIDSSVASDGGAGTVGSPWTRADQNPVQYALDNITRDSTDGDEIIDAAGVSSGDNLLGGTALDLSTYGTPSAGTPLKFTDCGLNGGGSGAIFTSTTIDGLIFEGCKLHNSGSTRLIEMDQVGTFVNCEFTNSTGGGAKGFNLRFAGCYFHNLGGVGILTDNQGLFVSHCVFANGTNDFDDCIHVDVSGSAKINHCNFLVDGATNAIKIDSSITYGSHIDSNSIFSNGGTGTGILFTGTSATWQSATTVERNLVEGFSGAGGQGIDMGGSIYPYALVNNAVYDCTTDYVAKGDIAIDLGNESLGASPFADGANGDFTPQDTGNVLTPTVGSWDTSDKPKGAWPAATGGGGSATTASGFMV